MAVSLSLDRHDPERELTSQLLSDLNGHVLTRDELVKGFDKLLNMLNDLILDTPNAPTVSYVVQRGEILSFLSIRFYFHRLLDSL